MKCPIDGEMLVMTERQGVEIDYCPKCRGVWLDRGELDKIIEKATGPMVLPDPEPAPAPMPAPPPQPAPRSEAFSDPRADLRDRDGPRHVDRGERDDWRREERHAKGRKYKGRYSDDDDDDDDRYYRRKKKRKSILSEIFDFD